MKKVSVIVLVYNQEDFITKNLQGIFMQKTNFPIELIISNDKSTDQTDKVIRDCIKNAPSNFEIKYTNHTINKGATPNFFWSLKQITGDYIAFCEGDDYWTDENKLQIQFDFLEENPDYSMCFHSVKNVSPDFSINNTLFSSLKNKDYSPLEIYQHWLIHTTSVFMKSSVLENFAAKELQKHPELLYFDTFLYMACGIDGKIRAMDIIMSSYLRHEAGISNGINYNRDLRHNHLDEVIGKTFGGKIYESANWQIFSRSRIAFWGSIKNGKITQSIKHLSWIFKRKGNLKVYLKRKYLS